MFFLVSSCNFSTPKKVEENKWPVLEVKENTIEEAASVNPNAIKFNLLETVLKNLNLKKEDCKLSLVAQKVNPINPAETIMVIPEIVEEDEYYFNLNSYIVIVETLTGKILNQFFETPKTNGFESDALVLTDIKIDTAPYLVAASTRAFGVRVSFVGSSRANPYDNEKLSLYLKTKDNGLQKILNNYEMMSYGGEWDTDCYGNFVTKKNVFIMTEAYTNNFLDILVSTKVTETENYLDQDNNCQSKDVLTKSKSVLKYNGAEYLLEDN